MQFLGAVSFSGYFKGAFFCPYPILARDNRRIFSSISPCSSYNGYHILFYIKQWVCLHGLKASVLTKGFPYPTAPDGFIFFFSKFSFKLSLMQSWECYVESFTVSGPSSKHTYVPRGNVRKLHILGVNSPAVKFS